jgi:hypothetical protein
LAIVVAVTVLATGNNPPKQNTAPSLAALAVKIAIGVGLIAIAIRQRRKMGQPKKPKKPPRWRAGVDNMSPWYAIGIAPTPSALGTDRCRSRITLEIYAGFRSEESQAFLARIRTWIDSHTDQAIIIGRLVLGFWLIGKSIYLIVT